MSRRSQLAAVLVLAAALRFVGLDWDQGHSFHPDERRIAFALEEITLRPLQLNPHFFSYGSFPIYVQKLWTSAAAWIHPDWASFHGRIVASRALSAIVGVALVAWLARLGWTLHGAATGVLAALLLALSVLPIQHSHFVTVDLHQAFLVLGALERLVAFHRDGRRSQLAAGAALAGFALATKVSSVPLALPLLLAPLLVPGVGARSRAGLVVLVVVVAAGCFALGEPYALLDRAAFLHDVNEQSAMVRRAGALPYTIQYLGTRPVIDDLSQAFTWGMGPALGVVAGLGTLAACARAARRPRGAETLLLAFFLPYFIVTATFPVKFMRYLLPLYPLWCLFGARLLVGSRAARGARRLAVASVVALTAAYALAFVSIYLRPHVWVSASAWFHREVPAGAAILRPHWEEGFPVDVPGVPARRYRALELPLYEPDGDAKIDLLAERLAESEVVVFPSKRLYGAIGNAPERFPRTLRLLELLFAGDLGYRLDRVFASRPRLLGVELVDDFADESFSVYDHPKTLVFRKVEAVSKETIVERVRSHVPSVPMTRERMLGVGAGESTMRARGARSSPLVASLWTAALAVLAFSGRRLLSAMVPAMPPLAVSGLGPPFGVLVFAYVCWLPPALGLAGFTPALAGVAAAALAAVAIRRRPAERSPSTGSFVLFVSFAFFLAIRAGNPEIYWGEKPMDFSFLNALYRSPGIPPPEPWMSGTAINYPYFGHFAVAAIGKLAHVAPALAFNLGVATVAALTASAAFGVGALVGGRAGSGLLAALLVTFAGNLAGPIELASGRPMAFDYFWATSRVVPDTINEFPFWSFLFADLHAHVMALPLSILFLGFAAQWFCEPGSLRPLVAASLALGAIAVTSTWSLPIAAAVLCALALTTAARARRIVHPIAAVLAVPLSYVWFLPYWERFAPPPLHWGFETAAAPLTAVLTIFGGFLLAVVLALADLARRRGVRLGARLAGAAVLALGAAHSARSGAFVLGGLALVGALAEGEARSRFAFVLAAAGTLLVAGADTIFFWDRMNTVFKLYFEAWTALAIATALWIPPIGSALRVRSPFVWLAALLAAASLVTAATGVVTVLETRRVPGPRPTLDGQAYLDEHRPSEARAIRWLNEEIEGTPVILEAQGPSYQEFGRVSMNTGLPTVLGWDYHLFQRAHGWDEINRRKADVAAIYGSLDRDAVRSLVERYRIALVYVGAIERETYPAAGLAKFDSWQAEFQPIHRTGAVAIYAATENFRWTGATAPPLEPAPPRAKEAAPLGQLREPRGVAIDAEGNVWVADFGNDRIQQFDARLEPLRAFGGDGGAPGELRDPCAVAVAENGRIYVADTWNHRVQVFDPEGRFLAEWRSDFYGPRGIAVGGEGSVYVADTGNGRIVKLGPDGSEAARFGRRGSGAGELLEPAGIDVGPDGKIYVADAGNRRIVVLSADGSPLAAWPVPGWTNQVYREPDLALLPDGRVAATDPSGDRVLFFAADGRLVAEHPLGRNTNPTGIALGRDEALRVAELKADRLVTVPLPPPATR